MGIKFTQQNLKTHGGEGLREPGVLCYRAQARTCDQEGLFIPAYQYFPGRNGRPVESVTLW